MERKIKLVYGLLPNRIEAILIYSQVNTLFRVQQQFVLIQSNVCPALFSRHLLFEIKWIAKFPCLCYTTNVYDR